jgi:NAD(P)-dependent dehydrogenase (short-subunit alcohol dehydrogenase family)
LSAEFIERGIRVTGLTPGPTVTPALGKLGLPTQELRQMQEDIRKLVPIGRMGTPAELAKATVFLASDASSFVVGTELQVDGGVSNL